MPPRLARHLVKNRDSADGFSPGVIDAGPRRSYYGVVRSAAAARAAGAAGQLGAQGSGADDAVRPQSGTCNHVPTSREGSIMRLEHRFGIVVCLAVLGVGTWFFMTRDTGTQEPVAAAPEASPAATDAPKEVKQASPTPTHTRSPLADRRDVRRRENRPAPERDVPSLSLAVEPERSTLPGIRSETPLDNRTSSVADATPKPVAPAPTAPPRVQTPTTRPATAVEAPPIGPTVKPAEPVAAAPEPTAQTHVLQKGESIARLAQKYYGSERFVPLILEANKQIRDPNRIPVGAKITIPPAPEGAKPVAAKPAATEPKGVAAAPEQSSPSTVTTAGPRQQPPGTQAYEVTPDDNWNKIAARVYGSASRWPELFELNKRSANETPRMLRAGEVIYIPATGTTDTALIGKTSSP